MKRKTFLKSAVPAILLPLMLNNLSLWGCKRKNAPASSKNSSADDRILVLVQLEGGNDGLNTVIPLDQYAHLANARKNILIPENRVLCLNNSDVTGFHPSMVELQRMYNDKTLSIIQGVGYPNPDFSHFRATDIWLTGSDSSSVLHSGWVGRFLDKQYPNYPVGYPNHELPDPPAIQIGSVLSNALQGKSVGLGMAITSTSFFYDLVLGNYGIAPATPAGRELFFVRSTANETHQYISVIKAAAQAQQNLSKRYPETGRNLLADQLKIVAQLIGGGLKTKIYMVNLNGFDLHNGQVYSSDATQGVHAQLLSKLSEAIAAFEDDLQLMGTQDKVLGMTISEFGRRIKSNASYGTDHGSTGPMFLFGSGLKGGIIGSNPILPAKAEVSDNLPLQHDFRSVYASVLKGWFGIPDAELSAAMLSPYPILDLFK